MTCDRFLPCDETAINVSFYPLSCRTQGELLSHTPHVACSNCAEGAFIPGEPAGTIKSHFQRSLNEQFSLLLTDAFGLPLKNCKIMADDLEKRLECDVWMPDYFAGKRWGWVKLAREQ